jgi:NAD dependent epimerase/dehydratase family enzyme
MIDEGRCRNILQPLFYFPSPKFLLQVGAFFINTEPELILKSPWVIPKRLLDSGFVFNYPILDKALGNILVNEALMTFTEPGNITGAKL